MGVTKKLTAAVDPLFKSKKLKKLQTIKNVAVNRIFDVSTIWYFIFSEFSSCFLNFKKCLRLNRSSYRNNIIKVESTGAKMTAVSLGKGKKRLGKKPKMSVTMKVKEILFKVKPTFKKKRGV